MVCFKMNKEHSVIFELASKYCISDSFVDYEGYSISSSLVAQMVKHLPTMREPGSGRSPGEGNGNPLQYSCLENPMDGEGYSPWGRKESDTTERLHFHFSLSCIGEGNGNPLQCSWLENPRDGGAWWLPSVGSHRVGHD